MKIMSEERKLPQIASNELNRRLDDLEKRALCLKYSYDTLIARVGDLEKWTTSYVSRIEREKRIAAIVEVLMRQDNRSRLLLDYVCVFFEIVLKKMHKAGTSVYTLKDLWIGLTEETTQKLFTVTTQKLGFTKSEQGALALLFEVVHDRDFSAAETRQGLTRAISNRRQGGECEESFAHDSDVASLFLFLQIQDELQTSVRAALRRTVAVAYCGLMGADDLESNLDIGTLTAQDIVSRFLTSTPKGTATSRSTFSLRIPERGLSFSGMQTGVEVNMNAQSRSPSNLPETYNNLSDSGLQNRIGVNTSDQSQSPSNLPGTDNDMSDSGLQTGVGFTMSDQSQSPSNLPGTDNDMSDQSRSPNNQLGASDESALTE